jgi:hypothetical protein
MNAKVVFKNRQGYIVTTDGREFELDSLVRHLQRPITIEEGITFRDLWSYIENESEIIGKIFNSAMGEHPIVDFIEESNKPYTREDEDPDNSIHGLELYWMCDYDVNYDDESRREISIFPSFHGYGRTVDKWHNDGKPFDTGYAMEYSPINVLMDYNIRINEKVKLDNFSTRKGNSRIRTLISGDKGWTVYDVLFAILYEITWSGSPKDREEKLIEMDCHLKKVKKQIEEGTLKTRTLEEVKKDLKKG